MNCVLCVFSHYCDFQRHWVVFNMSFLPRYIKLNFVSAADQVVTSFFRWKHTWSIISCHSHTCELFLSIFYTFMLQLCHGEKLSLTLIVLLFKTVKERTFRYKPFTVTNICLSCHLFAIPITFNCRLDFFETTMKQQYMTGGKNSSSIL